MYVSILCVISIDESPSLYFGISLVKNFFRSSGYFRGILFVLCETWRSAVLLVDGPKQSSVAKCRLLELSTSKMKTTCLLFRTISSVFFHSVIHRISTVLQLLTEMGDRLGFQVIVVIRKTWRRL